MSLRAGGLGLNLTAANHVFHFDRWWNPAVEDQASDRAHRIGQTRVVQVHKMVCAGTIEERIDELIAASATWPRGSSTAGSSRRCPTSATTSSRSSSRCAASRRAIHSAA